MYQRNRQTRSSQAACLPAGRLDNYCQSFELVLPHGRVR